MPAQDGHPLAGDDDQLERRRGGGDWDAHPDDLAGWVEPDPGGLCQAYRVGGRPIVPGEPITAAGRPSTREELARLGPRCGHDAPVGFSLCTPCHRARIADRHARLSLEHRRRIAELTGRPLSSIQ